MRNHWWRPKTLAHDGNRWRRLADSSARRCSIDCFPGYGRKGENGKAPLGEKKGLLDAGNRPV